MQAGAWKARVHYLFSAFRRLCARPPVNDAMTPRIRIFLLALALALPAPVLAQSVQDFQLPPAPTPTSNPQVEGPVDTESGPVPVRPRAIPTARPTQRPAITLPAPAPTATPTAVRSPATQTTGRRASPAQPRAAATTEAPPIAPRETAPIEPPAATGVPTSAAPLPLPSLSPGAPSDSSPALEEAPAGYWPWLAGLAALLLGAIGLWAWRRRRDSLPPPAIEPPLARSAPAAASAAPGQPLTLRAEAVKLTRSFAFATLDYRLTLTNRTGQAISGLAIAGDLVSAHGGAPMEEQVALATTDLPARHAIARLAPGQSQQLTGQVQLPIGTAQVIRQGRLPLLVPLLRVRVDGAGAEPLVRTFVIGQGVPDGGRLQPFRLDEGPRSYQPIAQRELAR